MKGLLIYASKTGNVKHFVNRLLDRLEGDYETINIKNNPTSSIPFQDYEKIVIGTYMRRQRADVDIINFLIKNRDALLKTNLYIFVSAVEAGDSYTREIKLSFPPKIVKYFEIYNVGATFDYDNLKYIDRVMLKNIAQNQDKSVDELKTFSEKRLEKFAEIVNTTTPQENIPEDETL